MLCIKYSRLEGGRDEKEVNQLTTAGPRPRQHETGCIVWEFGVNPGCIVP